MVVVVVVVAVGLDIFNRDIPGRQHPEGTPSSRPIRLHLEPTIWYV